VPAFFQGLQQLHCIIKSRLKDLDIRKRFLLCPLLLDGGLKLPDLLLNGIDILSAIFKKELAVLCALHVCGIMGTAMSHSEAGKRCGEQGGCHQNQDDLFHIALLFSAFITPASQSSAGCAEHVASGMPSIENQEYRQVAPTPLSALVNIPQVPVAYSAAAPPASRQEPLREIDIHYRLPIIAS
jgi:hypothetical protein